MAEIRKHRPGVSGPIAQAAAAAEAAAAAKASAAGGPDPALEDVDAEGVESEEIADPWLNLEPPSAAGSMAATMQSTEGWAQFLIHRPQHADWESWHRPAEEQPPADR